MKVVRSLKDFHVPPGGAALAIGIFDGVHIGHRKVIRALVAGARKSKLKSVVLTFDPHPAKVLRQGSGVPSLISLDHRIRLIEELGTDILVVLNFTKTVARLSPEEFVGNILVRRIGAKEVYVSDNFYFGAGAASGVETLKRLGRKHGFDVRIINAVKVGGTAASSSLIRKLIMNGDLRRAAKFLGRPVAVLGTVVRGANLARELGYPTANVNPHHEVIPPGGVYAVLVRHEKRLFKGVLNIGFRPTFYAPRDRETAIEVHIFDFRERIYGHDLEVFFLKKIREERKFCDKARLVRQIEQDGKTALAVARKTDIKGIKNILT